jgi:putative resolvase
VPARQVSARKILIQRLRPPAAGWVGLYAWVSSHDHRSDLDRQVARLSQGTATAGWTVIGVEAEVASGMDGKRPKLCRLLAARRWRRSWSTATGWRGSTPSWSRRGGGRWCWRGAKSTWSGDVVEVLTWFCARPYGHWSARNRALKASRCARYDGGSAGVIAGVAAAGRHGEAIG